MMLLIIIIRFKKITNIIPNNMAHKWIINDEDLILGDVEFHEDLLTGDRKERETAGGGRWYVDRERGVIFFWGTRTVRKNLQKIRKY